MPLPRHYEVSLNCRKSVEGKAQRAPFKESRQFYFGSLLNDNNTFLREGRMFLLSPADSWALRSDPVGRGVSGEAGWSGGEQSMALSGTARRAAIAAHRAHDNLRLTGGWPRAYGFTQS